MSVANLAMLSSTSIEQIIYLFRQMEKSTCSLLIYNDKTSMPLHKYDQL